MEHDRTDDGGVLPIDCEGSVVREMRDHSNRETVALYDAPQGGPANYSGFDTRVDETSRLFVESGYNSVVYCRSSSYAGKALKNQDGRKLTCAKGNSQRELNIFVFAFKTG